MYTWRLFFNWPTGGVWSNLAASVLTGLVVWLWGRHYVKSLKTEIHTLTQKHNQVHALLTELHAKHDETHQLIQELQKRQPKETAPNEQSVPVSQGNRGKSVPSRPASGARRTSPGT